MLTIVSQGMKGRSLMHDNPHPVPLLATISGFVTSAVGSVAQTASDATGQIVQTGPSGAQVAWAGTAIAAIGVILQGWLQVRDARRKADVEDARVKLDQARAEQDAKLDFDTKEQATWGPKYEAELDRRISAEARLKVAEEKLADMRAELDTFKHTAKAAVRKVNAKANEAIAKADSVADRVTTVEAVQGSLSGDNMPTSPGMRGETNA